MRMEWEGIPKERAFFHPDARKQTVYGGGTWLLAAAETYPGG